MIVMKLIYGHELQILQEPTPEVLMWKHGRMYGVLLMPVSTCGMVGMKTPTKFVMITDV